MSDYTSRRISEAELSVMEALWDTDGRPLEEVRRPQMAFRIKLPRQVPPLSLLRRKADLSP